MNVKIYANPFVCKRDKQRAKGPVLTSLRLLSLRYGFETKMCTFVSVTIAKTTAG